MKAHIITIGDEILIGQIVDTNSAWLARRLNDLGIGVDRILSISDTREAIHHALNEVDSGVQLVLMTGGLGPTKDDITKHALAEWFESGWNVDQAVLDRVEQHFSLRGVAMPEVNKGQAMVPDNCTVLTNENGTAPGMWFERNGTVFVSMPGVPFEMKSIFSDQAVPRIQARFSGKHIVHRTIMTQGIGESSLMEIIADWENNLGDLKLAYLPSVGAVRLRVTGVSDFGEGLQDRVDAQVKAVLPLIENYAYGFDEAKLEEVVGLILKAHNLTMATAESCTGGYIAHLITSIPGSSAYFNGSAVTYSNEAKQSMLGVDPAAIEQFGAVSEQVAIQMAEGARLKFKTDYAVSTTGIAGPDGGSAEKPVGTVWIGVSSQRGSYALKYSMGIHRERNIRKSALQAFQLIRKEIFINLGISLKEALS